MTARARLAFYASRFPMAEIATTYRFPPTPELAAQWAERTPPGFTFDIRAWSLLTGAPTLPDSLWPDLQDQVTDRYRDQRRLYSTHLSPGALDECWDRFAHALRPLADAGKLGVVILQYPSWFSPRPEAWAELADAGGTARLSNRRRASKPQVDRRMTPAMPTLEWLEEHGLAYVCVDGPAEGPRAGPACGCRYVGRRGGPLRRPPPG